VDEWDDIRELSFKGAVEVLCASECNQTVRVGQTREHSNLTRVLKLGTCITSLRKKYVIRTKGKKEEE